MNKLLRNKSIFPDLPDKPEYDTPVRIIYDNPLVDKRYNEKGKIRKFSKFKNTMEFLLKNAKDSAMFYIPYFSLTDKFKALLIREAKRGLKITILSNSFQSLDIGGKILYGVATYHFNDLLEAGVQIYEWTGHKPLEEIEKKENCSIPWGHWPGGTIHGKMALIDDQVSLIGSHNMNTRSERFNSETMAMVVDKKFGEKVKKAFLYDLDDVPNGEKRTIPCGDIMVERPRRVHHLTREEFNKKYSPRDIRKLKKYLKLRNIL